MSDRLLGAFPGLRASSYRVTSPPDVGYNCVAWAAARTDQWWWPSDDSTLGHWPSESPREATLSAFVLAFQASGCFPCHDETLEPGVERVAVFVDSAGRPTHVSRQLPTGQWTSKLGQAEDIEHPLRALEGEVYGMVAALLSRPARTRTHASP